MGKYSKKRLPKGFRYLFSIKNIKEIEETSELSFTKVSNGNVNSSKNFNDDNYIKSSFRAISIHSEKKEDIWNFSIHQNGFRNELLPESFEEKIKSEIKIKAINYLKKLYNSVETDFYKNPQLWGQVMIIENNYKIKWTEFK